MHTTLVSIALIGLVGLATPASAQQRNYIQIVGSSTVYPFATVVAEKFGKTSSFKTPIIEATGSGGGLKLFCSGVGITTPDFANSSRRIKPSELARCKANSVTGIIEVKIGYDGIVLANSTKAGQYALSRREIFLALAKNVPAADGSETVTPNPYRTWRQVNPNLPDIRIEVLGPPPTSGTRDAFVELVMEGGCQSIDWIAALRQSDKSAYQALCHTVREDGAFIEVGENDNLIVQKLKENPEALGIFGFSFLDQNLDRVQGARIDGVMPEFDAIADGTYPISRALYFYAKIAHLDVIPGMAEYMAEFTGEAAYGEEGYLTDRGLIPMPVQERQLFRHNAGSRRALETL